MVEVINQAESAVHDIETKIDEYKDQLPTEEACLEIIFSFSVLPVLYLQICTCF